MAGTGKYILGNGEVVTPKSAKEIADLKLIGVTEATPEEAKHDALKQQYSSWVYAPTALASGVVEGALPGVMGAAVTGADATGSQAGADFSQGIEGAEAAFPWTNRLGMGVGMVLGTPFKAVSAIGALGKGAYAAARGAIQAVGMTFDQRAIEHIETPEGAEKIAAIYFPVATLGALTGGTFSWAGGKLAAGALGKAGEAMEAKGAASLASKSPLNNPGVAGRLEDVGGSQPVAELAAKFDLLGKSPKVVRTRIGEILKSSTAAMNEAKAVSTDVLPLQEHAKFIEDLKGMLKGTGSERLVRRIEGESPTVGDLHQVRIGIDRVINREGEELSQAGAKLADARDLVGQQIESVLQHNAELRPDVVGDQLARWQAANADYHAASMLKDALKYSEDTGKSFLGWAGHKMVSAGTTGALFSGVSGNPAGIASGLGMAGVGKAVQAVGEGSVGARLVQGAGKFVQTFDDQVVQRIVTGLGERSVAGQVGGAAAAKVLELGDYTTTHAYVSWASENPTLAVPKMAQALEEHGVPGPLIDSAIPQTIVGVQYLAAVRPKSPWAGQTVAPLDWQPDLHEKALFLDRANTVMNPLQALQELTPERAETLRAVYPILTQNVANIAAQEAATRPDLSRKARQWVSMLTGVPASPLDSPQSQAVLAMLDLQQSQPAQATRQQTQGSRTSIGSTPTRLDRLSS